MSELDQKDREYLAVVATEVINKVAKGCLEDLNPELYVISKSCSDCHMSVIPQKMQDWTPAARHALLQLCNCKIKTRLNLAPATVFHPKRINESYDNAMTLRARDIWYKILFDDLRLDKKGREILRERGLNPRNLYGGNYLVRWPGYGYPKVRVPDELPVKSERGLAIPALTPFLEIQGLQVKPYDPKKEGKRYHTVGSKKGGSQPLFSLPNGDTPVYCWIPKVIVKIANDTDAFKIGICEGGLKPAIAASIMNQIFLGSFTRRISDYTLLRYLMDIERKILNIDIGSSTIVVYPDSGTTHNPDVCYDSLYCVFACAAQGYDVRIGWWGQTGELDENMTEEEQIACKCDIDELIVKLPNYKNIIKELSISEFYELIPEETMDYLISKSFGDPDENPFEYTDVVSDYYTVYDPNHKDPINKIIEPIVTIKPKVIYDKKSLFNYYLAPLLDPNANIEEIRRKEKEKKEMIEKEKQKRKLLNHEVPIPPTLTKAELFDQLFGNIYKKYNKKNKEESEEEDDDEEEEEDEEDYNDDDDDDDDDFYKDSDYSYDDEEEKSVDNNNKNEKDEKDEKEMSKIELFNSLFGSLGI